MKRWIKFGEYCFFITGFKFLPGKYRTQQLKSVYVRAHFCVWCFRKLTLLDIWTQCSAVIVLIVRLVLIISPKPIHTFHSFLPIHLHESYAIPWVSINNDCVETVPRSLQNCLSWYSDLHNKTQGHLIIGINMQVRSYILKRSPDSPCKRPISIQPMSHDTFISPDHPFHIFPNNIHEYIEAKTKWHLPCGIFKCFFLNKMYK